MLIIWIILVLGHRALHFLNFFLYVTDFLYLSNIKMLHRRIDIIVQMLKLVYLTPFIVLVDCRCPAATGEDNVEDGPDVHQKHF